jgi:hypothetical protein
MLLVINVEFAPPMPVVLLKNMVSSQVITRRTLDLNVPICVPRRHVHICVPRRHDALPCADGAGECGMLGRSFPQAFHDVSNNVFHHLILNACSGTVSNPGGWKDNLETHVGLRNGNHQVSTYLLLRGVTALY